MTPNQDPATVMRDAENYTGWARWEPGDGTAYRVKVHVVVGGPDHADRILLVSCAGRVAAVQYADPQVAAYRVQHWNRDRWRRERRNPDPAYDWWPHVVKPLLVAVGVARGPLARHRHRSYSGPGAIPAATRETRTVQTAGAVL